MMPKLVLPALVLALTLTAPPRANASVALVPDNYPSIQAGVNSGADSVVVRDGTYQETVTVDRFVTIVSTPSQYRRLGFPVVRGLIVTGPQGSNYTELTSRVYGFHFTGPVRAYSSLAIESCRLDSGLVAVGSTGFSQIGVRGCTIFGDVALGPTSFEFTGNTIVEGSFSSTHDGYGLIRDNYISGNAQKGIYAGSGSDRPEVTGNRLTGFVQGIVVRNEAIIRNNTVSGSSGSAIVVESNTPHGSPVVTRNIIHDCGGFGIDVQGGATAHVDSNSVDRVGLSGVHFGAVTADLHWNDVADARGHGIWAEEGTDSCVGNRVLRSGGDGVRLAYAGLPPEQNVIGHSGARGLVIQFAGSAHHNTSYLNAGSGFELHGAEGDSIQNNIAYGNGGYGLNWLGSGAAILGCNDWFENASGATSGVATGATDLAVNPLFCDAINDDVGLSAGSPLLNAPGCGRIGALGMGCGEPLAVALAGRAAEMSVIVVRPVPSPGKVRFSWKPSSGPAHLEIFDVSGARRWRADLAVGSGGVDWTGTDVEGKALPAGIYYGRLNALGRQSVAKVVLTK